VGGYMNAIVDKEEIESAIKDIIGGIMDFADKV
jgi:hypothetical protein